MPDETKPTTTASCSSTAGSEAQKEHRMESTESVAITHLSSLTLDPLKTDGSNNTAKSNAEVDEAPLSPTTEPEQLQVEDVSAMGKMRAIFGILTKFIGVKDLVNMRVSLPAQLLDPISNLEFWTYLDCPELFSIIPDADEPVDRMLNVVRFWFSKDTKFLSPSLAKPYNSLVGEEFIAWQDTDTSPSSETGSTATSKFRVWSLIEQISHHPPVSAYYYCCPEKQVVCRGVDHLCAKFTGTSAKIFAGHLNHGLYLHLGTRDNEEYNLTHPSAYVNGWLKFSLYVTVGEYCYITCPKSKLAAVLEYKDEPFFGKPKFAVEGKLFRYDPDNDDVKAMKFSKIPDADVVCTIEGSWKGEIFYRKKGEDNDKVLLVDISKLSPKEKSFRPMEQQGPMESRRLWHQVSEKIRGSDFAQATKLKRDLEDAQRAEEKKRKHDGQPYRSRWFAFLDKDAVGSQPGTEAHIEGANLESRIIGKPFIRKDMVDKLPWVEYKQQ
jgi:hypothetical protein